MAKDYNSKRQQPKAKRASASPVLLVVLAFLGGYFVANAVDFNHVNRWLEKNILAEKSTSRPQPTAKPRQEAQSRPKFEFYTLLSKDSNGITTAHKTSPQPIPPTPPLSQPQAKAPTISKPAAKVNETFLIQIAAYNKRQDAERLKAMYALKGYDVNIQVYKTHENADLFRVLLGPFTSRSAAENAQATLARQEHVKGLLRRV